MNFKKLILWMLGVLFALVAAYEIFLYIFLDKDPNYFHVDRCIDSGGCWDGVDKVCRKNKPNAQELCDRSKVSGKTLEQRIEEKINNIKPDN